jgi:hypothetical protein
MDLQENQCVPHPGVPELLHNVIRNVTERLQDCQQHVGIVLQNWQNSQGRQDVLQSIARFRSPDVLRKRRRRNETRFASLAMSLDGERGPSRSIQSALDGLCVAPAKSTAKGRGQVSFPPPRREDQERILISEVRRDFAAFELLTDGTHYKWRYTECLRYWVMFSLKCLLFDLGTGVAKQTADTTSNCIHPWSPVGWDSHFQLNQGSWKTVS